MPKAPKIRALSDTSLPSNLGGLAKVKLELPMSALEKNKQINEWRVDIAW